MSSTWYVVDAGWNETARAAHTTSATTLYTRGMQYMYMSAL